MSFGLTVGLLKDVLPVDTRTNAVTIRNHLHKVALQQEAELGDGQPRFAESLFTGRAGRCFPGCYFEVNKG